MSRFSAAMALATILASTVASGAPCALAAETLAGGAHSAPAPRTAQAAPAEPSAPVVPSAPAEPSAPSMRVAGVIRTVHAGAVLRTTTTAATTLAGRTLNTGVSPTPAESKFVTLLNQERIRRGVNPLSWEPSLCRAGRQHSEEMARMDYFDHRSPVAGMETPADRWERIVARTPDEYVIGENLFFGSVPDVGWGHRSLMESEGHRRNILNAAYTKVGVGVYVDRRGQMWVTEMFLS